MVAFKFQCVGDTDPHPNTGQKLVTLGVDGDQIVNDGVDGAVIEIHYSHGAQHDFTVGQHYEVTFMPIEAPATEQTLPGAGG